MSVLIQAGRESIFTYVNICWRTFLSISTLKKDGNKKTGNQYVKFQPRDS